MSNLRKEAKGRECQVRIPGICNHNHETVVLAHLGGGGMGTKQPDLLGAFCCSTCHDAVDGRSMTPFFSGEIQRFHLDGVIRTQLIWINDGLVKW